VHTVVLVEGLSDQLALETLAARRGRDLGAEGVAVVPMGGATNIGRFLGLYGPDGSDLQLAGLYDAAEEHILRRGLERANLGSRLTRAGMEALGFHVCVADLEDELIRAVGPATVEHVLDQHGDLASFRIFQQQPAQRGKDVQALLRRFMGTRSGRKFEYARSLVAAMDLARTPRALDGVLAHV